MDVRQSVSVLWGQHSSSHRVRKVRRWLLGTRDQVPLSLSMGALERAERIATSECTFRIWWRMVAILIKCGTKCEPLRFGQDCARMVRTVHSDRCLKVTLSGDCSASGRDNLSSEMSLHPKDAASKSVNCSAQALAFTSVKKAAVGTLT
ncbi:hypothetical protein TNCV_1641481 [Trichonephila clavipes]|nr:hypothetical protein TNCV_1641481 [Trichonephila clavipes]